MKKILQKLAEDDNNFECQWNGVPNKCKILILDLVTEKAFVRFETPIKKMVRKEIDETFIFSLDMENSLHMEDVEVESFEEWISL